MSFQAISKMPRLEAQVCAEARSLALAIGHAATYFRGWRRTKLEVQLRSERLVAAQVELQRFQQVQAGLTAAAERVRNIVARRLAVRRALAGAVSRDDRRSVARTALQMFRVDVMSHLKGAEFASLRAAWLGIGKRAAGKLSLSDRQWGLFEALIRDARIWHHV